MLSDGTIRQAVGTGEIGIDPLPEDQAFQPASIDLRLGTDFLREGTCQIATVPEGGTFTLLPGQCALACTMERITLPATCVARVEGKSTWGRQFLLVHSTAGFIDPGFSGSITLELKNLNEDRPLVLVPGWYIAQISFQRLDWPAVRPYGADELRSRYQHQSRVTPARP